MYKKTVLGSYHQGHTKYGLSGGKQCVAMVYSYFLYTRTMASYNIGSWDLDMILDMGNKIYEKITTISHEEYLTPSRLPSQMMYGDRSFDGKMQATISGVLLYDVTDLLTGLQRALTHGSLLFFVCNDSCIGIQYVNDMYYVFDSHGRDHRGFTHHLGASVHITFNNIQNLGLYLRIQFHHGHDKQYQLIPFHIIETGKMIGRIPSDVQVDMSSLNENLMTTLPFIVIPLSQRRSLLQTSHIMSKTPFMKKTTKNLEDDISSIETDTWHEHKSSKSKKGIKQSSTISKHDSCATVLKDDNRWVQMFSDISKSSPTQPNSHDKIPTIKDQSQEELTEISTSSPTEEQCNNLQHRTINQPPQSRKRILKHGHDYDVLSKKTKTIVHKKKKNSTNSKPIQIQTKDNKLQKRLSRTMVHTDNKDNLLSHSIDNSNILEDHATHIIDVVHQAQTLTGTLHGVIESNINIPSNMNIMTSETNNICSKHSESEDQQAKSEYDQFISHTNYLGDVKCGQMFVDNYDDSSISQMVDVSCSSKTISTNNDIIIEKSICTESQKSCSAIHQVDLIGTNIIDKLNAGCDYVCVSCKQIFFARSVQKITEYHIQKFLPFFDDSCLDNEYYACFTCLNAILEGKIPILSYRNGMKFPDKPHELELNKHEEMLISLRIMFQNIKLLPRGSQYCLLGNVINVPANIEYGIINLPRYINSEGTVSIRVKRRLRYQAVYRKFNVRPEKVMAALHWLLQYSPLYKEHPIKINDTWLAETITQIRDNSNNPDVQRHNDSDTNIPDIAHIEKDKIINDDTCHNAFTYETNTNIHANTNPPTQKKENDQTHDGYDSRSSDDNFSEIDVNEQTAVQSTLLDQHDHIQYLDIAPGEHNYPKPLFYDEFGEELAFPTIYCGKKMSEFYPDGLKFSDRIKWELRSIDRRVAQHHEKIFTMYKKYQSKFISNKQSFALKLLKNKQYKCSDVRDIESLKKISGINDGFYFYNKLRNSPMYLDLRKRELMAVIRQRGIPTWFLSLSSADLHWPELLKTLYKINNHTSLTDEDIDSLDYQTKCNLVNNDPVTTARYFDNRMNVFIREVLIHPSNPIGVVSDFFYKIEFQHRGSPHVHMLVWIDDAPQHDEGADGIDVCSFIDKYVSCSLDVPDVDKKFLNVQIHSHSRTCRKKGKSICRFRYPHPPMRNTVILGSIEGDTTSDEKRYQQIQNVLKDGDIIKDFTFDEFLTYLNMSETEYVDAIRTSIKQDKIYLKRNPNEIRVNPYMKNLYGVWAANHDIQFCLNTLSVVMYVITYIQKTNRGLSLGLSELVKEFKKNEISVSNQIKKIGNVFQNATEISIQEAIYMLLGLPMCYMSRQVQYISTNLKTDRIKVLKNSEDLQAIDDDSTEICFDSWYDKYEKRPPLLEDWCFADFLTKINITNSRIQNLSNNDNELTQTVLCHYKGKRYSLRRKFKILQYDIPTKALYGNDSHRVNLLLFHPWRNEDLYFCEGNDYSEMISALSENDQRQLEKKIKEYNIESQTLLQRLEESVRADEDNNIIAPSTQHENANVSCQADKILSGKDFFVPQKFSELNDNHSCSGGHVYEISQRDMIYQQVERLWSQDKLLEKICLLNEKQELVFQHVMKHILLYDNPLYLFITGGAGVGKSLVLETLSHSLSRFYNLQSGVDPDMKSVLCVSYTGKSAFVINGETIHSAFGIIPSRTYSVYISPSSDTLNRLRNRWKFVKILLIDEVSFLGSTLFNFLNLRLQEIYGNRHIFGGIHVITFGDMFQLAPIGDNWIFDHGKGVTDILVPNLWKDNFRYFELTEIMRQKQDQPFAKLLNRIRTGEMTDNDVKVLQTRITEFDLNGTNLPQILCARNIEINIYNTQIYEMSKANKCVVYSQDAMITEMPTQKADKFLQNLTKDPTKTGCLDNVLYLCEGLIYDIVVNIDVSDGLVNGCSGQLKYIQYTPKSDNPSILWFLFDVSTVGMKQRQIYKQYCEDDIDETWRPIFPITKKFFVGKKFIEITRTQFPVRQASAKTIHKSQGSTYDSVIVDLTGPYYSFFRHMAYVALSRVRSLDGLTLTSFDKKCVKTDQKVLHENSCGLSERALQLNFNIPTISDDMINIMYQNAQSLRLHFKNIMSSIQVINQHVLLFCESHLTENDTDDSIEIQDYELFRVSHTQTSSTQSYHGLVAYIHSDVSIIQTDTYVYDLIECFLVKLTLLKQTYVVVLLYKAPGCNNKELYNALRWCKLHLTANERVVILGDFNIDVSSIREQNTVQNMINILQLNHIDCGFTTRSLTALDLCFSDGNPSIQSFYVPWSQHLGLHVKY